MAKQKYDWPAAEQTFMNAPDEHPWVRLKDISLKFGIPYQTVRRYAAKHKWNSRRDNVYYEIRKKKFPVRNVRYSTRGMPASVARLLQSLGSS